MLLGQVWTLLQVVCAALCMQNARETTFDQACIHQWLAAQGLMDSEREGRYSPYHGRTIQNGPDFERTPSRQDLEAGLRQRGLFSMIGINPVQVSPDLP